MTKRIAAISGSLRKSSTNTDILNNLGSYVGADAEFLIYEGLDKLPYFSPELDTDQAADSVLHFREFLRSADAVVICTPEYAFGVPGVLKNALDWLVSSAELYQKPVATISASPTPMGGDKAHESLRLTLSALDAKFIENGKLIIPFIRLKIDSQRKVIDSDLEKSLRDLILLLTN